jgi:hypothetical protein
MSYEYIPDSSHQMPPVQPRTGSIFEGISRHPLASIAMIGAMAVAVEVTAIDSYNAHLSACAVPDSVTLHTVDTLMANAASRSSDPWSADIQAVGGRENFNRNLALTLGLSIHDEPTGYFNGVTTFATALERANALLEKNYHISIDVSTETYDVSNKGSDVAAKREFDTTAQPLTPDELGQQATRITVEKIVDEISTIPAELIAYSGLQRISLNNMGGGVEGLAKAEIHAIFVSPTTIISSNLMKHELYHLIDSKQCNSLGMDSALEALNPEGVYTNAPMPTLTELDTTDPAAREKDPATQTNNEAAISDSLSADLKQVAIVEPYGRTNVAEDKATIGQYMLNTSAPDIYRILNSEAAPILHAKYRLLFARLYSVLPAVATYYLQHR